MSAQSHVLGLEHKQTVGLLGRYIRSERGPRLQGSQLPATGTQFFDRTQIGSCLWYACELIASAEQPIHEKCKQQRQIVMSSYVIRIHTSLESGT
jgi:hypothetical protein